MDAFYFIDKPLDITSFDVIRKLRKKFNIRKMGHTGTLDPLATGGLLIATGNYTKLIPYFEKDFKTYEFEISFDGESDSFDLGTEVRFITEKEKKYFEEKITKDILEKILKENFFGEIIQIPPKYSALKINGKKALERIKNGEDFEIKSRKCNIFEIELLDFIYPKALIRAKVSAGTYIRSIASDLGKYFGSGAYVTKLRRTFIGDLDIKYSHDLENISLVNSLDLKNIFKNNYFINIPDEILKKINNGQFVFGKFDYKIGEDIFVFDGKNITHIVFYDGEKLYSKRKI